MMQGDCTLQTCSHLWKVQLTLEQQTATGVYLYVNFFFNSKYCGIIQSVIGWIQGYRRTVDMEDQLDIICRFSLYGGPASLSLVVQGSIVHVTHVGSSKENKCATYWMSELSEWSRSVVSDSLWHMDCSLPGSAHHGILQARILEWVAISFSRGSSWLRDQTWVSGTAGRCFNLWATREAHTTY